MGHKSNGLILPQRSLASTPEPTFCLAVADIPIHVLSCLNSISTLTASFALQDQHRFPITLRLHPSILFPSLSHAMFPV